MRYWWVNQNQTFRQEISGGYLWSPKRNANGARNPFYEFMREIAPGDLVFSFADTRIIAVGVVGSYCYESPKPSEFGEVGLNWEAIGWRVRVKFISLLNRVRPKDHIDLLKSLLPPRYSPLQGTGNGIQSVYLTAVPTLLAEALIGLIGAEAEMVVGKAEEVSAQAETQADNADVEVWEHHIEATIESDSRISDTDREALIIARRGQGLFKQRVTQVEHRCRLTGVSSPTTEGSRPAATPVRKQTESLCCRTRKSGHSRRWQQQQVQAGGWHKKSAALLHHLNHPTPRRQRGGAESGSSGQIPLLGNLTSIFTFRRRRNLTCVLSCLADSLSR